jgi:flagellar operon protein
MINQVNQYEDVRQMKLRSTAAVSECGGSFGDMLKKRIGSREELRFSRHATDRVKQRGIEVSEPFLNDLQCAVEKARSKGAKDVVIISERGAFIVNVPNNTVVTTMSGKEMKENIFTNIDSAILL